MSVNNVYNNNKLQMVKLGIAQRQKTAAAQTPVYLTKEGSIFNAPNAKSTTKTGDGASITDLNTQKSISELNKSATNSTQETSESSGTSSAESIAKIDNASDGKAAANSMETESDNVKQLTSDTQKDKTTVDKFSSDAAKLDKQISKDDKKYEKQLQKQEKQLKADNKKLEKVIKENEEAQKEIEEAQNELDSLLASNSFTVGQNGESTGNSQNSERIQELATIISSKSQVTQANGRVIYSLQRSSSRTLKQMGVTNKAYIKTQNANQKTIEENQSTTDKVIQVAGTIEQISSLVSQGGQALGYAGKGLVALGQAAFISGPAAAALISTGTIMQKIGKVAEMVGNYGQAAANVTKTAAYAADGNLAGALQSAAAAIQTGAAAGKATKDLKTDFASIDDAANKATEKAAANQAAAQQVKAAQEAEIQKVADKKGVGVDDLSRKEIKQAKSDALGGMSSKEARKNISADLQNKFDPKSENPLKLEEGAKRRDQIKNFRANNSDAVDNSFKSVTKEFKNQLGDRDISTLGRKARKQLSDSVGSKFRNIASNKGKKSAGDIWQKLSQYGSSLQSAAALFADNGSQTGYNSPVSYSTGNYQLSDATLERIRKMKARQASISSMYM